MPWLKNNARTILSVLSIAVLLHIWWVGPVRSRLAAAQLPNIPVGEAERVACIIDVDRDVPLQDINAELAVCLAIVDHPDR